MIALIIADCSSQILTLYAANIELTEENVSKRLSQL